MEYNFARFASPWAIAPALLGAWLYGAAAAGQEPTRQPIPVPQRDSASAFCPTRSLSYRCTDALDGLQWQYADSTGFPPFPLAIGHRPVGRIQVHVHACRAYFSDGSTLAGAFVADERGPRCLVFDGRRHEARSFEVLLALPEQRAIWIAPSQVTGADLAITSLREPGREGVLLCRAPLDGGVHPGTFAPGAGCRIMTLERAALVYEGVEVLVVRTPPAPDR